LRQLTGDQPEGAREAAQKPITSEAIPSRSGPVAVRAQPYLKLGRLILQNDPIQETALQGQTDGKHAQAERLAPGVCLQLVLLHGQLAIQRMQTAGYAAAGEEAPVGNGLVSQAQRNIHERFVLDVRQARLAI